MTRNAAHVFGTRATLALASAIALAIPTGAALAGPAQGAAQRTAPAGAKHAHAPAGQVIVVMRGQAGAAVPGAATRSEAADTARAQQDAVSRAITRGGGQVRTSFTLINAVAATLSQSQADRLAADPDVAEVVPDARIATPRPSASAGAATGRTVSRSDLDASGGVDPQPGVCPTDPSKVQRVPEPVAVTRADSDQPGAVTARSLGYDGTGVTVAYMAEGIDINNPDFIRDGHSIFTDYRDFSGDGTNAPTPAAEAFIDASAIAAQGNQTYDVSHFSKLPLNRPCLVKVEGEAPGVNLVGLKVFGESYTTTSGFLSAIQYAVKVDHVDVLNQSFGGSPLPDTSRDVVKAADEAAVAAGTTVVASTGDAGITNTIGSPASDPAVIAAGASTTYRINLQTGYAAARFPQIHGWLDNNISSLSSAGVGQAGRTVDLVAPGELSYALCSKDVEMYDECGNYAGKPSHLEASGGTSESAPRIAGVAALVIQAYRAGHGGASPTPAEVKSILTSTADDIGAPAEQQGAGLVDAARAVQLAHAFGSGGATAAVLRTSRSTLLSVGKPGRTTTFDEQLTNESGSRRTVRLSSRTLGAYQEQARRTVRLDDTSSPKYTDFQGYVDNYSRFSFTVPSGADRLQTSIAYRAASPALAARVRLTLVDPEGRLAAYSLPQGIGNYGHAEVAQPTAGTWTAIITSRGSSTGGTTGPVLFSAGTARYTSFGTVSPSRLTLDPGASGTVHLTAPAGSAPGDVTGSLVAQTSPLGGADPLGGEANTLVDTGATTVPVVLRSIIPAGPQTFTKTLTGPNGRDGYPGVTSSFQIAVRSGTPALNASLVENSVRPNQVQAVLVSPQGAATAFASNTLLTSDSQGQTRSRLQPGLQLHTLDPRPGLWTLVLVFAPVVNGKEISSTYQISTDNAALAPPSTTVPNSADTKIAVGAGVTREVTVTNPGPTTAAYFVDPRSTDSTDYELASLSSNQTQAPPVTSQPFWLVPSNTTSLSATATTTGDKRFTFDLTTFLNSPDIASNAGLSTRVDYAADPVQSGLWLITAGQVGPSPADGSAQTPEPVTAGLTAHTLAFDDTVTSSTGDLWRQSIHPNESVRAVLVPPGGSATIQVRLRPTGAGEKSGVIYLDDISLVTALYGTDYPAPNANQIAAVPYRYTAVDKN